MGFLFIKKEYTFSKLTMKKLKLFIGLLAAFAAATGCSKDDAPFLTVTPATAIEFSAEAKESVELAISTNQEAWDAVSDMPWCTVTKVDNKLEVKAVVNDKVVAPSPAKITITAGGAAPVIIEVTQKAAMPYITITTIGSNTVSQKGGTIKAVVTSNISWTCSADKAWAKVTRGVTAPKTGETGLTIEVSPGDFEPEETSLVTAVSTISKTYEPVSATLRVTRKGPLYRIGDIYPNPYDEDSSVGVVFWLDNPTNGESTHGLIVCANETSGVWGVEGVNENLKVAGIQDPKCGATGTVNMINAHKNDANFSTAYYAFSWVDKTMSKYGNFYLPSSDEMRKLFAGYCGLHYESIKSWDIGGNMPGYNDVQRYEANKKFDASLQKAMAGSGISLNSNIYYTANEYTPTMAISISFTGGACGGANKSTKQSIRAVAKF